MVKCGHADVVGMVLGEFGSRSKLVWAQRLGEDPPLGAGAMTSVGLRIAWDDGRVGPSALVSRGAAAFWFAEVRLEDAAFAGASRVGVRGRGGWQRMLATAQLAPEVALVILFI